MCQAAQKPVLALSGCAQWEECSNKNTNPKPKTSVMAIYLKNVFSQSVTIVYMNINDKDKRR